MHENVQKLPKSSKKPEIFQENWYFLIKISKKFRNSMHAFLDLSFKVTLADMGLSGANMASAMNMDPSTPYLVF